MTSSEHGGRGLARRYHADVVRPLLLGRWPGLRYAAGRLGQGSEVLGLDDEMSRDHDWGLRLTLLVAADVRDEVEELLERRLPESYAGLPTRLLLTGQSEPVLGVDVWTPEAFVTSRLGLDPRGGMDPLDWLSVTGQAVLEVVAGPVFHDSAGEITDIRERLTWYPDEVWRSVVACDWTRLSFDLPLMSRAGDRGDDLGSRVLAARLVDVAMHLGLLLTRRWAPYPKWRGTVFTRVPDLQPLVPVLTATLQAETWRNRQESLRVALDGLLQVQRATGLPGGERATAPFHDRPYLQVDEPVIDGLLSRVSDPDLRDLPRGRGSIEQRTDDITVLRDPVARASVVRRR